jgi:RNA recognition motif-containing protein
VDFYTKEDADRALQILNGKKIYNKEIKVNWAAHATNKEDTSSKYTIFAFFPLICNFYIFSFFFWNFLEKTTAIFLWGTSALK